jgi:hypothetical protein
MLLLLIFITLGILQVDARSGVTHPKMGVAFLNRFIDLQGRGSFAIIRELNECNPDICVPRQPMERVASTPSFPSSTPTTATSRSSSPSPFKTHRRIHEGNEADNGTETVKEEESPAAPNRPQVKPGDK